MGHSGKVGNIRLAGDGRPEDQGQIGMGRLVNLRFDNIPQIYRLTGLIGYLDAHHCLSRYGRDNPDRDSGERHREVIGKVGNPAHLYARRRFKLIHGDDRARPYLCYFALDAIILKLLFKDTGIKLNGLFVNFHFFFFNGIEKRYRRKFVGADIF